MSETDKKNSSSIIIDSEIHKRFKVFCRGKNLKIGGVVEKLILLFMKEPKQLQKMIDENNI